ncbi:MULTISPECIES: hypothetical protein [Amycolatopsis]|uniref:Uncharacterized protein n=1 Tax=Amycolatopsis dendrobii TaxID=2760662 RepID=A0A7W3VXU2_9PSEU|nr:MULTISPECIES: hypothetical protein [Amycolatopsis]MBB1154984.1 hypothetical protein [Amycolatopsis dendrobii]UKD56207.1 hypothetical protein L3Q65_05675 [Amycolatopsis sp. FU40]
MNGLRAGLAVVGDSAPDEPEPSLALLRADARAIREHTGTPASAFAVRSRNAGELSAALRSLPSEVEAVYLTGADPAKARAAQRDIAAGGGIPVITEEETSGIVLAAAVLIRSRRLHVAPFAAKVVVAGADAMPLLVPLLVASGVGDVVAWRRSDAAGYPLAEVARNATVVVDAAGDLGGSLLVAPDRSAGLLPLPGLFAASRRGLVARPVNDPLYQLDVHRACAHALTTLAPVDRLLPELSDPDLAARVSDAIEEALRPPRQR